MVLSSISSFVVGCIKKKFSFGFLSVSWKFVFYWIILETSFVAIELKKLLNLFGITLLSVTIESFICKQIGTNLVWAFMFINTFISCQILYVFFLFFSNRFLKKDSLLLLERLVTGYSFQGPLLDIIYYRNYFPFL